MLSRARFFFWMLAFSASTRDPQGGLSDPYGPVGLRLNVQNTVFIFTIRDLAVSSCHPYLHCSRNFKRGIQVEGMG